MSRAVHVTLDDLGLVWAEGKQMQPFCLTYLSTRTRNTVVPDV